MKYLQCLPAILLLLFLGSGRMAWAQEEEFNPSSPAEPGAASIKYKLSLRVEPSDAGCSASGAGSYVVGSRVSVSTSNATGFVFDHWEEDGVSVSTSASFDYTTKAASKTLVAHYRYDPTSPSEPAATNTYRLYLTTNIEGACSFNRTSGNKCTADNYVSLTAYVSSDYTFRGWYDGSTLLTTEKTFSYLMPFASKTLRAVVEFDPSSPGEPNSVPYTRRGDINDDGTVNVMDAIALIGYYLQANTDQLTKSVADTNKDNAINVMDAIEIINLYLNNK